MSYENKEIKTWLERLYSERPELRGQYPEDGGALDEIGCWAKDEEIEDLRAALASTQEEIVELRTTLLAQVDVLPALASATIALMGCMEKLGWPKGKIANDEFIMHLHSVMKLNAPAGPA